MEILKEYAKKDKRMTVIRQDNSGSGHARNAGLTVADGEFIAFMDSDDMYPSDKTLEHLYTAAIKNKVFICGGTGRSFAAAALIDDFGMELVGLETPTYDADAQVDIEYLNGIHKNFVVDIANMQPFEQVNLINKLKPDAFIGVPEKTAPKEKSHLL